MEGDKYALDMTHGSNVKTGESNGKCLSSPLYGLHDILTWTHGTLLPFAGSTCKLAGSHPEACDRGGAAVTSGLLVYDFNG